MLLGTLDRTPPPFFRQGPSARTKLLVFSLLAVGLMVADARWRVVEPLRATLATALLPAQRVLAAPVEGWQASADYLRGLQAARAAEAAALASLAGKAQMPARIEQLEWENARLRELLGLRPQLPVLARSAQVLLEAADPYSRKVIIDRGAADDIRLGSPVMVPAGLLGQVTRVYPLNAEVTLLTDQNAAIPVLNERTRLRAAAFGGLHPGMELRFVSGDADVQPGDRLVTGGLDGVFPPGLPVATIVAVERRPESGFARIRLAPLASADGVRHVLVLDPVLPLPTAGAPLPGALPGSSPSPTASPAPSAAGMPPASRTAR